MSRYSGMSNDYAARAYASDCDAMYADELSNSQYDAIELRLKEARSDLREYGAVFFAGKKGERMTLEAIIDDFDEEFISTWVHENFVFTQETPEGQAAMYRTMRDAFINRAMDAIQDDLKNSGEKFFYDILARD